MGQNWRKDFRVNGKHLRELYAWCVAVNPISKGIDENYFDKIVTIDSVRYCINVRYCISQFFYHKGPSHE